MNGKLFRTAFILFFVATAIAVCIANAIEEATKPVPGWGPKPSITSTR